jgi:hypothetical protein
LSFKQFCNLSQNKYCKNITGTHAATFRQKLAAELS